jgi:hypothetical protein
VAPLSSTAATCDAKNRTPAIAAIVQTSVQHRDAGQRDMASPSKVRVPRRC